MKWVQVKQGDCLASIADQHGFFWEQLWNHQQNSDLKEKRKNPNVLLPGDKVFIPDLDPFIVSCPTGQAHKFMVKGVPEELNLQMKIDGLPVKNTDYILELDGQEIAGTTDGEGRIVQSIMPSTKSARVVLGEGEDRLEYNLNLGHLDPIDEVSGVQARLDNLGFGLGKTDGELGQNTAAALKSFQEAHDLDPSGELDQATKDALLKEHES